MLPAVHVYQRELQEERKRIVQALEGLSPDALNWQPLPQNTNSLFVLATHLLGSEREWLHHTVGNRNVERDRAAEFRAQGDDVAALRAQFADVGRETDEVLSQLREEEMDVMHTGPRGRYTVRWCILHVLEHYAEHAAHMELTRQLWEERERSQP